MPQKPEVEFRRTRDPHSLDMSVEGAGDLGLLLWHPRRPARVSLSTGGLALLEVEVEVLRQIVERADQETSKQTKAPAPKQVLPPVRPLGAVGKVEARREPDPDVLRIGHSHENNQFHPGAG